MYEIVVGYLPREEPLLVRDVTWALDSCLFGFRNPRGYHLGNVLLHAANCVLVLHVVAAVTGRTLLALGSAVVFAVIPIHVQAVSWEMSRKMSRKDVLVGLFMLLAPRVQVAASRTSDSRRRRVAQRPEPRSALRAIPGATREAERLADARAALRSRSPRRQGLPSATRLGIGVEGR